MTVSFPAYKKNVLDRLYDLTNLAIARNHPYRRKYLSADAYVLVDEIFREPS